jgi:hypothetical protein
MPTYVAGLRFVGWPGRGDTPYTANVIGSVAEVTGSPGKKQFLVTGFDFDGYERAGAITRRDADSVGFWLAGNYFARWRSIGSEDSYLGWPLTEVGTNRQYFEGGCIWTPDGGQTYHDAAWGYGQCTF